MGFITYAVLLAWQWHSVEPAGFNHESYYPHIANVPYMGQGAPQGYRLLSSLLVRWLPFSIETGFKIVNISAIYLAACVLMAIGRAMGLRGWLPVIAPIPYLLSDGVRWQLKDCFLQVDAVSHLLLSLTVLAFLRRRDDWVSFFSVLGVFARETALFFIPAWYVSRYGWRIEVRSVRRLVIVWGPPILLFVLIRFVWHPLTGHVIIGKDMEAVNPGFWEFYAADFLRINPSTVVLFGRLFSFHTADLFFGTLLPLFLYGVVRCGSVYRRLSLYVLVCWLQLVVANDTGRLVTFAFPVLIPVSLLAFQNLLSPNSQKQIAEAALAAVLVVFPNSLFAGMALLIGTLLLRTGTAAHEQKRCKSRPVRLPPGAPDGFPIPKWTSLLSFEKRFGRFLPYILTVVFFIWFAFFCVQTYRHRPRRLLCLPPTLCPAVYSSWDIFYVLGGKAARQKISPSTVSSSKALEFGKPDNPDYIVVPLPEPIPTFVHLVMRAFPLEGDALEVGTAAMNESGTGFSDADSIAVPVTSASRLYRVILPVHPHWDCVSLGTGPEKSWVGSVQFILYDISYSMSACKEQGPYR